MKKLIFAALTLALAAPALAQGDRASLPNRLKNAEARLTVLEASVGGDGTGVAGVGYGGAATANATLGAELVTNPSFTGNITGWTGTNWAYEASNKARHSAGSTAALTQTITVAVKTRYLISFTQTGRTAGSVTIAIGSQNLQAGSYFDEDQVLESTQTGAVALNVTPTTDYDGALTKVSVKPFATLVPLTFHFKTGDPAHDGIGPGGISYGFNARFSGGPSPYGLMLGYESGINNLLGGGSNSAFGDRALEAVTTGYWNHAFGYQALLRTTNGIENVAMGKWAMANNTGGTFNVAIGNEALVSNRTGGSNVSVGWRSLHSLTTGTGNSVLGVQAGRGMTTGGTNVCIGNGACWSPAGQSANALTTTSGNTYVGVNTGQASTTQRSNSSAFGEGATVDASNFVTIGNGAVTVVSFGSKDGLASTYATGHLLVAAGKLAWSSTSLPSGTLDIGLRRGSAGFLQVTDGATGNGGFEVGTAGMFRVIATAGNATIISQPSGAENSCVSFNPGGAANQAFQTCRRASSQTTVEIGGSGDLGNAGSPAYQLAHASGLPSGVYLTKTANDALGMSVNGLVRELHAVSRTLADNSATTAFQVAVAADSTTSLILNYSVEAENATDQQVITGQVHIGIINDAGTETCSVLTEVGEVAVTSTGTITFTATCSTSPTNAVDIQITSDTSLNVSPVLVWSITKLGGAGDITIS